MAAEPLSPVLTGRYTPAEHEVGAVIAGRYKLLEPIGEGGMGAVWVAEQTEPVRRKVALKLIKISMDSKSVLARFEQERQALALMDHPNIAKVLDGGTTTQGRPFFVMEYVKGVPFTQYCDDAQLSVSERLELFVPVCQAVQHAHQKGIVHRDLKPSNILVCLYDGKPAPKVIDFGLAKAVHQPLTEQTLHTAHGVMMGTPLYMSPEQAECNNLDIDTRSDIYSLGVILYELLTGTTPLEKKRFLEAAWQEMLRVIKEEDPPKPSMRLSGSATLPSVAAQRKLEPAKLMKLVRGELDWIVMKCLDKERSRRYETANGLAMELQRYLAGEPVQAAPPSAAYRLWKFARKNRAVLTTAAMIASLLIAGIAVSAWQAVRATRAEAEARENEQAALRERDAKQAALQAETLARQEAEKRRAEAEAARQSEERERKFAQAIAAFVKDDFFALTSVEGQDRFGGGGLDRNTTLLDLLHRGAEKLRQRRELDPRIEAELCWIVGVNYRGAGEAAQGVPFLERAVELQRQVLGAEAPETINALNSLALCYDAAGQLNRAVPLYEETLKLMTAKLGADHPATLTSMSNLALGYRDAGQLDRALPLYEETLKLRRAKLGADHPDTLASMNSLALGFQDAGQLDRALPLYEETLKLHRGKLGADHPHTLTSMNNLAGGYWAAGQLDLALPLLEETLKLAKSKLGADHPQTLGSMVNLAVGYRDAGDLVRALPLFEQTLKLRKAKLGAGHPDTLTSMNNLAMGYLAAGQLDLALPLHEESLKLRKAKLGADHPDTLTSMNNLAEGYRAAGLLDRALPLYEEAAQGIEKRRFQHENAHLFIPNTIRAYEKAKQFEQAEGWRRKWLAAVKERAGADSLPFARELAALGENLLMQNKWTEAEAVLREGLAIREKKQPDDWTTFHTMSLLGDALLGQKKYAEAQPLLVKGYEGMKSREKAIPPEGKPDLADAIERLARLYEALDKPDEAAKRRQELEAAKKQCGR